MRRFIVLFTALLILVLGCARSSTKGEEADTLSAEVDANLPHDYPHILIPPNATYTHGSTGMMKAEANPESHAHFVTYGSKDSVLAFFRGVEGFQVTCEGQDSAGIYYIALEQVGELADFQFVADLAASQDEENRPVIHIDIAYWTGIGIRYPGYFD